MYLNLLNPEWAEALGWTLLHSLWQGTLVFVLTLPVLILYKKHAPQVRYNLLCLSLLVLVSSMALTFCYYMPEGPTGTTYLEMEHRPSSEVMVSTPASQVGKSIENTKTLSFSFRESVDYFVHAYSGYLVHFWLIGVCFFAARWMAGLLITYRLKNNGVRRADVDWQNKVDNWSEKMGINKGVQLLESIKTEVPLILGHLKPVVLLPMGTLNGLAPEQVEAIIIHELAHIRRHDFLMNLFIAALEMILFYHPVYWWLSNQIQQEREQCCDDIAVAVCGNARLYARTLLLMEEKRQQNSLAMAYQGKKHHLLDRIKRICLAAPASYRTDYGKAGLSLALLLVVAVISWAKIPERPDFNAISNTLPTEISTPLSEKPDPMPNPPSQVPTPPSPEAAPISLATPEPASLPDPNKHTLKLTFADTIPYAPKIPRMGSEPTLPEAPEFPYTPEELEEALENKDSDFLANTILSYQKELQDWQKQVKSGYLNSWNDRNNLIVEVYQSWKEDLKSYRKTDEIAFMVALKKGIRYFEDELKGYENAVKKAENAVKSDVENYIKSFENQVKVHENKQSDHDSRMAVHDDRMRVHDLRMAVHDGRMQIHDQRMQIHDTRMMFHDERMAAHDVIIKAFEKELFAAIEADGLGKNSGKKLDFSVEDGQVKVNGTVLQGQPADKYLQLIRKYGYEPPKDGVFFFKIGKNNRSMGTSSSYSMDRKE